MFAATLSVEAKQAYEEGVRALESGSVSVAESAFLRAQSLASDAPEPLVGRARALVYGVAKLDATNKPRLLQAYALLLSAQTKSAVFFPAFYEAGRVAYMIGDDKSAIAKSRSRRCFGCYARRSREPARDGEDGLGRRRRCDRGLQKGG